ncbi:MAG: hypothetical protein HN541_07105 [Euryarchaeota archaeon]|jgi:hypothetical protein|nr:hypothetical protein [Euryarchaeota archaeon]
MAKESTPDEIVLDDIMKESVKDIGKGEAVPLKEETEINDNQEQEPTNPQFGFKLEPVQAQEEFVVSPEKEEEVPKKEQVILDKPSQDMDDDIIVEW